MALTQMTDDWLREIDDKKIVGAVLLDFCAAFDIIDYSPGWIRNSPGQLSRTLTFFNLY